MKTDENNDLEKDYNKAIQFTKSHYENFPVVSSFIRKNLRKHIAVIYQFARQADDLADEGNNSQEERLKLLEDYELKLINSLSSNNEAGFWKILKQTINDKNLDKNNFFDLLNAFKQDVRKKRYRNFDELLDYCSRSANPVGRLILELHNIKDSTAQGYSDKICTALQLTNFYQDVSLDILKERIYIPLDELKLFDVEKNDIKDQKYTDHFTKLMKYQIERTKKLFVEGRELLHYLPYRLKVQILVTIKGGEAILDKIILLNYNVLETRPTLSKIALLKLFISGVFLKG